MKDWERVDRIFEQIKKTSKKIAIDDRIAPKRLVAMTNNMIVEEYRDGILK
jgi:hypothetical protein